MISDAALKRLEKAYTKAPRIPGVPVTVDSDDLLAAIREIKQTRDKLYQAEKIADAIKVIKEVATGELSL